MRKSAEKRLEEAGRRLAIRWIDEVLPEIIRRNEDAAKQSCLLPEHDGDGVEVELVFEND